MEKLVTKDMIVAALKDARCPWPLIGNNKIRIVADLGNRLLIVCSDDISAFDAVMKSAIPYKGIALTQTSAWWFEQTARRWYNHFISADLNQFPAEIMEILGPNYDIFSGRTMLVKKAEIVLPYEFIARWFLEGTMAKEYATTGMFLGEVLPQGLQKGDLLPEPFFNVSTKAGFGKHDVNLWYNEFAKRIGVENAQTLKEITLGFGNDVRAIADTRGLIYKDGKIEIGIDENGRLMIMDEAYTSDAARVEIKDPEKRKDLSKEPVREYLKNIGRDKGTSELLPGWLIEQTSERYLTLLQMLTDKTIMSMI